MKHVIIGSGPAGVIAAETIRKNAPHDDILLIGAESEPPYSRMAIPYLLSGNIGERETHLRKDPNHFDRLDIRQKSGRVRKVDSDFRSLMMDDGSQIGFDQLLLATGSRPVTPVIPGIRSPGVHTCWTLDDARKIMQLAKPKARVVLVGAGFIGCIVMEALAMRGVQLVVVEKKDHMVPNMMGKGAGTMLKQWCERKGIKVHTSSTITQILPCSLDTGAPLLAQLSSGEQLRADLIVVTTGARPNVRFLRDSGIRCQYGVLVDATMQTNVPGIYAAGDCAEAFDAATGQNVISAVQPNAADQAYCAALNMTGKRAFQRGVRQIDVLETLGLVSTSLGQWRGVRGGEWVEMRDDRNFKYLRLEFSKDVLVGSNAIGLSEHAGILRGLIQQQIELGEWKDKLLKNPALLKEAYSACAERQYHGHASILHAMHAAH